MLKRLDHVNVRTANLDAMIAWYGDVLGMTSGDRPPFSFGGAWMYADGYPIVHLVKVDSQPEAKGPALEHFAVTAGCRLAAFLDHLEGRDVAYRCGVVPGFGIVQVNVHDPDGNHIHIDFPADERATLEARGLG